MGSRSFLERLVEHLYQAGIYRIILWRPSGIDLITWSVMEAELVATYPDGKYPLNVRSYSGKKTPEISVSGKESLTRVFEYFNSATDKSMYMDRKYILFLYGMSKNAYKSSIVRFHLRNKRLRDLRLSRAGK